MQAAVMRAGELVIDEVQDPTPGPGQLLVRTLACGICGSDLHALRHGDLLTAMSQEAAASMSESPMVPEVMDLRHDVVMGHEFSAEVIALGENVGNSAVGDMVVSMPIVLDEHGIHPIGYSNHYAGGYAELMVLSDLLALKVPNGLDARRAALTEPMAVGLHAVNKSRIQPTMSAVVLGCGPVGLAVIAALRLQGIDQIVAADLSARRRSLASTMGATMVVDPREQPAVAAWQSNGGRGPLVIFEAVGVPGMIDDAMRTAPRDAHIVVVGVCMLPDTIRPMRGISRELSMQFALGYDPLEFADTLRHIAEGEIDVAPLITGSVDVPGVPGAFAELANPEAHAKILVEPGVG
ncbi:MAG: zinc-binding dehydrogenase [Actinomycetota bacterium]|nr:zinc-binding dehydrogenase [Actinomycetota bacterium]